MQDDLLSDVGMSAHSVDGDIVAFEVERFKQAGDGINLVDTLDYEPLANGIETKPRWTGENANSN